VFNKIVKVFDASVLGIDVIFEKGIEHPYTDQRCIFLEVNSRPYMKMHDVPRYGEKEDLTGFYASMDKLVVADSDIF
jgi:D-alanine-D-alanine ligase-like ATP-grasp enzyme